ncbi:glutathione peroxidase [Corynebacterium pseudopelargi]|uniref:Glutathione peroxidase n=1 Tax=Corynebacterium pseudopelargi TaxID=2080757 RepID=A0A3G6ISM3_9CORY|nr:glutathione peroxidase [Corynebacterium pseudopelargi]AZA08536.1 Hydroperoxy fatty acid reductase gpx1 [Corynebacterium pseudopelargi]
MNFFDIPITYADGRDSTMADFQGHCLLIVNTASKCGYTEQLETLEELFQDYMQRGLFVIGVPSDDFQEEPLSDKQIAKEYANYGVSFPLLAKGSLDTALYSYLIGDGPGIEWNFEKFVVSPEGKVVGRFAPSLEPDEMKVIEVLEEHLPV